MDYIVDLVPLLQDESYRATWVILSTESGKWSYDALEILYVIWIYHLAAVKCV